MITYCVHVTTFFNSQDIANYVHNHTCILEYNNEYVTHAYWDYWPITTNI